MGLHVAEEGMPTTRATTTTTTSRIPTTISTHSTRDSNGDVDNGNGFLGVNVIESSSYPSPVDACFR